MNKTEIQIGDVVYIGDLKVVVEAIIEEHGEIFIQTSMGNFNISICSRAPLK